MRADCKMHPFMCYLPGKVQIPFYKNSHEAPDPAAEAVRGKQHTGETENKGKPNRWEKISHTTQRMSWTKNLQNLIIIPESALGVCLPYRNAHQEPQQILGLTVIIFVSWFWGFLVFFHFKPLSRSYIQHFIRILCLSENPSPTGWFRQLLSHLHVLGRLDKTTRTLLCVLCVLASELCVFPKPKYSSGEGRQETNCLQDKKSLQTSDGWPFAKAAPASFHS